MTSPITDEIRAEVRAYTESNMIDSVTVLRGKTGPGVLDEDTGRLSGVVDPDVIYTGKARLPKASAGATVSVGEGEVATRGLTISVPWVSDQVRRDDVVRIDAALDGQLVGSVWRVLGVDGGGAFGEARHLLVDVLVPQRLLGRCRMTTLDDLAKDLAHAAGAGGTRLAREVQADAETELDVGRAVANPGPGLRQLTRQQPSGGGDASGVADSAARRLADGGAELALRKRR